MQQFDVFAGDAYLGAYPADSEQGARNAAAIDAGYLSESDMVDQLGAASVLTACKQPIYAVVEHLGPDRVRTLATVTGSFEKACELARHTWENMPRDTVIAVTIL